MNWKDYKRHPVSAEYENIAGEEWERFLTDMKEYGFDRRHPIYLYDGMIVDGWQRQRACIELDIEPHYITLPPSTNLEAFIRQEQENRRHESEETRRRRVEARRQRVASSRRHGKSIRTIAEEESVSKTTIERDIEEIGATVPGGTVEGKDGKEHPAMKGDRNGVPWPRQAIAAVEANKVLNQFRVDIGALGERASAMIGGPLSAHIDFPQIVDALEKIRKACLYGKPDYVCPYCEGLRQKCGVCRGHGWVPAQIWDKSPAAYDVG